MSVISVVSPISEVPILVRRHDYECATEDGDAQDTPLFLSKPDILDPDGNRFRQYHFPHRLR